MNLDGLKEDLVPKYVSVGYKKFYQSIILLALQKLIAIEKKSYYGVEPHLEYLDYHDKFIILFRREGEQVYLDIAKMFRNAAHKIYRIMLYKKMIDINIKFLNLV